VLQISLPDDLVAAMRPGSATPAPTKVPPVVVPKKLDRGYDHSTVLGWSVAAVVALVAVGVGLGTRRRS
jgi:hypothetical protein